MKEIIFLRKLYAEIRKWENQRDMTSSTIMKLLKLYIGMGVDKLMDKEGKIHCQDFNKMATILHCRTSRLFIENVVNSGSFVYEKCNHSNMNIYGIQWLASSLFHTTEHPKKPASEQLQNCTPELQNCTPTTAKLHCNSGEFHLFNKYIKDLSNIPSGGIACAHASDSSGVAQSVQQKVSPMVNNLLRNPEVMKKMYHSIIEVLDKCINRHGDKFLNTSDEGKTAWAGNIIGSKYCKGVMTRKAGDTVRKMEEQANSQPAVMEHPHGEHEYSYPGIPQRYYDLNGSSYPIPDYAPDRPSPTATWNKFLRSWKDPFAKG